jgi:DNA sulfur modification protein DndB
VVTPVDESSIIKLFDTVQQARDAAVDDQAATGGSTYPCVVFKQGNRIMVSTGVPLDFFQRHIREDWVGLDPNKGVRDATNRPLITDHVKNIRNYIIENPDQYILPPITLNMRETPRLYVLRSPAPTRSGFLVVDNKTRFYVTDGQHRIAAIVGHSASKKRTPGVLDTHEEFGKHGATVHLIYEPDLVSVHQDFADAAQTKPIPPSLLASYNMREPINRVLSEIVIKSFLGGRIDESSKSLSQKSNKLFLLNQVRGAVKELLVRDYAKAEQALLNDAHTLIPTREKQDRFVSDTLEMLEVLSTEMEPWNLIATEPVESLTGPVVSQLRDEYVNLTATGLVLIGRAGYEIQRQYPDSESRKRMYRRLATEIPWRRDSEFWSGGVIQNGKVITLRGPVRNSATKVLAQLGLIEKDEAMEN